MPYTGIARTNQLLNVTGLALNATGNGSPLQVPRAEGEMYVTASVTITGALSVIIQGRDDSLSAWTNLITYTVTGGDLVAAYPQMRATYSGASASAAGFVAIDRFCKPAS